MGENKPYTGSDSLFIPARHFEESLKIVFFSSCGKYGKNSPCLAKYGLNAPHLMAVKGQ